MPLDSPLQIPQKSPWCSFQKSKMAAARSVYRLGVGVTRDQFCDVFVYKREPAQLIDNIVPITKLKTKIKSVDFLVATLRFSIAR